MTTLSLTRRIAPRSAYLPPDPNGLADEIVQGKRELDRLTDHVLWRRDPESPTGSVQPIGDGSFSISLSDPLPLPEVLSCRLVDGAHLWIAVEEGLAIVLDDEDHARFLRLRAGDRPDALPDDERVHTLIARLASSGFIPGIQGYTDVTTVQPGRFMRVHLTQRCNLSCIHCYADSSPQVSTKGQLTAEQWSKIITDFAAVGGERILFTGGEALIYPGCVELLQLSHRLGLHVTLFSNGILVPENISVIRETVDDVQISIDGPDAATNDPIRGKASFRRAVRAIDCLVDAGVHVRVGVVLMERNWRQIRDDFLSFAQQWQGRNVDFRIGYGLTHHGRGSEVDDSLNGADTRRMVEDLMDALNGGPPIRIARKSKGCGYAEQIVVGPDGSIHPCHLLDGALSHVHDQPMEDLVRMLTGVANEYNVDHNVGCNRCDIRNLCGGTCRVKNGKITGNRRITICRASDKMKRLRNLTRTFLENDNAAVPANLLTPGWE